MFQHSEADVKKVKRVQFGLLSPEEVKGMSVCHVESDRTFEAGRPVPGGLLDLRLGTIDRMWKCASCGMDQTECPGHFGHIELAKPMYHLSQLNNTLKCLRCMCFSCSVILGNSPPPPDAADKLEGVPRKLEAAFKKKNPAQRLRNVMEIAKTQKHCWACSAAQPSMKRDGLTIQVEFKEATEEHEATKMELSAERAHRILKGISDADCMKLGFNPTFCRPDWMIITVLPVPPPQVRPSIRMADTGGRGEDDLTVKLMDIMRANKALREHEKNGAPNHIQLQLARLLQYHLATFIDNLIPGQEPATTRTGRPLKSISQRLKGKEVAMAYPSSTYAYPKPHPQP